MFFVSKYRSTTTRKIVNREFYLSTVSYTHLDVYKRQTRRNTQLTKQNKTQCRRTINSAKVNKQFNRSVKNSALYVRQETLPLLIPLRPPNNSALLHSLSHYFFAHGGLQVFVYITSSVVLLCCVFLLVSRFQSFILLLVISSYCMWLFVTFRISITLW